MKKASMWIALALLLAFTANAQQGSNGSMPGTVTDPSGQSVPAAKVKVVSELNGEEKSAVTNEIGDFFFPALAPGSYIIRVEAPGFRPLERKGNMLAAAARLALGKLQLEVGSVTESVQVTAQSAQVATTTTAQAATIDSKQMDLIIVKGRDPMSVFKTLPGVTVIADQDTWGGSFQSTVPTFQGRGGNTVYTDGVNGGDGGGGGNFSGITSHRRHLRSQRPGELLHGRVWLQGRRAGQHGDQARRLRVPRHAARSTSATNSSTLRTTSTTAPAPRSRATATTTSATIGGPVPVRIPVLNRDKKSFNFFYSVEHMGLKDVNQLRQYTMPTALERGGDFSQTRAGGSPTGALVAVRDPLTGAPFPGNLIPVHAAAIRSGRADEHLSAAQRQRRRLQLPHPGAQHRPPPPRATDALRLPPDGEGHVQRQVSELVYKVRGLGGRRRLLAVGSGAPALRLHRRSGQGGMDAHLDAAPGNGGLDRHFLQHRTARPRTIWRWRASRRR